MQTAAPADEKLDSVPTRRRFAQLPEDVVCEILRHCRGIDWSYRDLSRLVLINRADWLEPGRRALYRSIRLDYRHEVVRLAACLSLRSSNASHVRELVMNGDAAHVPQILPLLSTLGGLQHAVFFDFELWSDAQQESLCKAVERQSVTHLSLKILPEPFVLAALEACAPYIETLDLSRVTLCSTDWQVFSERCVLSKVTSIEMGHVEILEEAAFDWLVTANASRLTSLRLKCEGSSPLSVVSKSETWEKCAFSRLEELELHNVPLDTARTILSGVARHSLKSLTLAALLPSRRIENSSNTPQDEQSPQPETGSPSGSACLVPSREQDTFTSLSLLSSLPASLELLHLPEVRDIDLCYAFCYLLGTQPLWLPRLRFLPSVAILDPSVSQAEVRQLKEEALRAARERGIRWTQAEEEAFFVSRRSRRADSMS